MKWIELKDSPESIEKLKYKIDWSDAFIKEFYAVSPSFLDSEDGGIVAVGLAPSMKALICLPAETFSLEIFHIEIEEVSIWFGGDIDINFKFISSGIICNYSELPNNGVMSKSIKYRKLSESKCGELANYGWEEFYDKRRELIY